MNVRLVPALAFTMLLAVTPAAAAATTPTAITTAAAPVPGASGLPMANRALTTTVSVEDAQLTVHGTTITVDLRGPAALVMSAPATGGTEARAAYKQQLTGTHPELGRITVTTESTAGSTVTYHSVADAFPAKLDIPSDFTVEIEHAPKAATRSRVAEPPALSTQTPGRLVGRIDGFPPQGDLYRLQHPVDLTVPDDVRDHAPDQPIATIDTFTVRVAGR